MIVGLLAVAVPASAINPFAPRVGSTERAPKKITRRQTLDVTPYRGLGTWVDMYDADVWKTPEEAVLEMQARGVRTLYLQTANWHKPKASPMFKPSKVGRFIDAAHAAGITVVGWYVPGFRNLDKDRKRTKYALEFQSATGQTFDSFAMDIESTAVRNIDKRNEQTAALSRWIRRKVGPGYALGGIVPDVQSLYWPNFPYYKVGKFYDVVMPMAYYSYRVSGKSAVYNYVSENVDQIRSRTADPSIRIHPIGGIGGETTRREARGYVNAVVDAGVMGGSYYDFPITAEREWEELYRLRS
ncbi:MAG: hypothetical protein ACLGHL_04870 [Actinomycetota bacterium]